MTEQWGQPEVCNQTLLEVLSSPVPTNSLYLFAAASFAADILFFSLSHHLYWPPPRCGHQLQLLWEATKTHSTGSTSFLQHGVTQIKGHPRPPGVTILSSV